MNLAIKTMAAGAAFALCAATATIAQTYLPVVSKHRHATATAAANDESGAGEGQGAHFRSSLDRVFGQGRWRETSGYRTPAEEDELRRMGAGTVAPGRLSHHSMGTPDAPGAYDVVVPGISTENAAVMLRDSGEPFARVFAEGAHGPEGSHLHIEPGAGRVTEHAAAETTPADTVYLRVVGGRRNPVLARRR